MKKKLILSLVIGISILYSGASFAHKGATGIVKERMDLFSKSEKDIKALFAAIKNSDMEKISIYGQSLADWAEVMPDYFPEGSNVGVSDASDKIWGDFDGFKQAAAEFQAASISVVEAAKLSNIEAIMAAASSVGKSCKSCHTKFKK